MHNNNITTRSSLLVYRLPHSVKTGLSSTTYKLVPDIHQYFIASFLEVEVNHLEQNLAINSSALICFETSKLHKTAW